MTGLDLGRARGPPEAVQDFDRPWPGKAHDRHCSLTRGGGWSNDRVLLVHRGEEPITAADGGLSGPRIGVGTVWAKKLAGLHRRKRGLPLINYSPRDACPLRVGMVGLVFREKSYKAR